DTSDKDLPTDPNVFKTRIAEINKFLKELHSFDEKMSKTRATEVQQELHSSISPRSLGTGSAPPLAAPKAKKGKGKKEIAPAPATLTPTAESTSASASAAGTNAPS
ncbi:MAG: hypothetical protein WC860_01715, partial [Candidatus Margulisiibacteriota bacterium]